MQNSTQATLGISTEQIDKMAELTIKILGAKLLKVVSAHGFMPQGDEFLGNSYELQLKTGDSTATLNKAVKHEWPRALSL